MANDCCSRRRTYAPGPNLPAGLRHSSRTASHRLSCFASTKLTFVISHTRLGAAVRVGEPCQSLAEDSAPSGERLLRGPPAIHGEVDPGDGVCGIARQEQHRRCDLVDRCESLAGLPFTQQPGHSLLVAQAFSVHELADLDFNKRGLHPTRTDGIAGHPRLRVLQCDGLRETSHSRVTDSYLLALAPQTTGGSRLWATSWPPRWCPKARRRWHSSDALVGEARQSEFHRGAGSIRRSASKYRSDCSRSPWICRATCADSFSLTRASGRPVLIASTWCMHTRSR